MDAGTVDLLARVGGVSPSPPSWRSPAERPGTAAATDEVPGLANLPAGEPAHAR